MLDGHRGFSENGAPFWESVKQGLVSWGPFSHPIIYRNYHILP